MMSDLFEKMVALTSKLMVFVHMSACDCVFPLENNEDNKVSGQPPQSPALPQEQSGRTASHS